MEGMERMETARVANVGMEKEVMERVMMVQEVLQ